MRSSLLAAVVGAASLAVLALVVFTIAIPLGVVRSRLVWYQVGAVSALALLIGGGAWCWLDRPLEFTETFAIAAVVAVGVAGVSLFQSTSQATLWFLVAYAHQFTAPTAFMLPLGAAATRRQRLGTVGVMALPALSLVFFWSVLRPDLSGGFEHMISMVGGWFVFSVAVGIPLLVAGHRLAGGGSLLGSAANRLGALETG